MSLDLHQLSAYCYFDIFHKVMPTITYIRKDLPEWFLSLNCALVQYRTSLEILNRKDSAKSQSILDNILKGIQHNREYRPRFPYLKSWKNSNRCGQEMFSLSDLFGTESRMTDNGAQDHPSETLNQGTTKAYVELRLIAHRVAAHFFVY